MRRTGESNCDAILRLIAIQLLPDAVNKLNVVCDQDYLFDYISSHCDGKNIVLLIDELNALSVPLDADAAATLKIIFWTELAIISSLQPMFIWIWILWPM